MLQNPKIVIFYALGTQNVGDHALSMGALRLLSELVSQENIVIVSRYARGESLHDPSEEIRASFPSVKIVPSPYHTSRQTAWDKIIQIFNGFLLAAICVSAPKLALRIFKHKEAIQEVGQADLVVLIGGNLLYWHQYSRSVPRLAALIFPLLMADRLGIPYGFLPQTSGPFEGKIGQMFAGLFERAQFVLFRDQASLRNVEKIADLSTSPVAVVPDLAYCLDGFSGMGESNLQAEFGLPDDGYIAVTLRTIALPSAGTLAGEQDDPNATIEKLISFLPEILANIQEKLGKKVVLVAQVVEDTDPSKTIQAEILKEFDISIPVIESRDLLSLLDFYANASFVIGMRMHSLIFGLSQGTLGLGIWRKPLGPKIPSMMSDLGLGEYAFELDELDPAVVEASIYQAFNEREQLEKKVDRYLERKLAHEKDFLKSFIDSQTV